jgi:hypothetical protein
MSSTSRYRKRSHAFAASLRQAQGVHTTQPTAELLSRADPKMAVYWAEVDRLRASR